MSPTILADDRPVARVAHKCALCLRTIEPGETYHRQRNVYDGRAYTFKGCLHCVAMVRLCAIDDWCDDNGYTMDTISEWEPVDIPEARLRAQWRRDWRRLDGTLYPVPTAAALQVTP